MQAKLILVLAVICVSVLILSGCTQNQNSNQTGGDYTKQFYQNDVSGKLSQEDAASLLSDTIDSQPDAADLGADSMDSDLIDELPND